MKAIQTIRWFVLGGLLVFLVLIAGSLLSLRDEIDGLEIGSTNGPVWFVNGIEFDTLRLELALADYGVGKARASEVNRRFDVLWSRLAAVGQGDTAAKLAEYEVDTAPLTELFRVLEANEDQVVGLSGAAQEAEFLSTFGEDLQLFRDRLRALSLDVLEGASQEAKSWRDGMIGVSEQNTILLVFVVIAFFTLLLLLVLENLQTRTALREKEGLLAEARAANVVKSEFISVMNHELRTPLSSIRGAIALLDAKFAAGYSDKERQLIKLAKRNAEHLTTLVQDILEVEKFGSGRFEMEPQITDLAALIRKQIPDFVQMAKDKNITIREEATFANVTCTVDQDRMRQVMSNLVYNAIKFSPADSTIRLGVKNAGTHGVISVKDEGIGIPADAQPRVFDAFYQVDSSTARKIGGTGLGLSICKSIVDGMGGKIWLESVLGQGAEFFISFPQTDKQDLEQANVRSTAA